MTTRRKRLLILAAILSPLLWLDGGHVNAPSFNGVYVHPRFLHLPQLQAGDYYGVKAIVLHTRAPGGGHYNPMPLAACYEDGKAWIQWPE